MNANLKSIFSENWLISTRILLINFCVRPFLLGYFCRKRWLTALGDVVFYFILSDCIAKTENYRQYRDSFKQSGELLDQKKLNAAETVIVCQVLQLKVFQLEY